MISLSRNFGHQAAVTAELRNTTGDAVVIMDADMQDPPEVMKEMIELWEQGKDVINSLLEHNKFLRGLFGWVGFKQIPLEYERKERYAGKTKYPLKKMIKLASDGIMSFSTKPLKTLGILGILSVIISIIILIYALISYIFNLNQLTAGWTSLMVTIYFFRRYAITFNMAYVGIYR